MAATLHDAARREELARRLDALPFDRRPLWGRMTAPQMVTHLLEAFRMPSGELEIAARPLPLKPLLRWVMLYVLPFPKGAPTARELLARKPQAWDRDVAALRDAILAVRAPAPGATVGEHPLFGRMSAKDWGVLLYKHADHHLRQFGV
jgi:hypothetical protein